MEALDLTRLLAVITFGVLTAAALYQWSTRRVLAAGWLFASFALVAVAGMVLALVPDDASGPGAAWLRKLSVVALVFFPYCVYRFTTSLAPASRRLDMGALAVTLIVAAAALVVPGVGLDMNVVPTGVHLVYLVLLGAQLTLLSGFAGARLWTSGRDQPHLVRRRTRVLSVATVGLAITLGLAVALVIEPGASGFVLALLVRITALVSALLFLIGFMAPRALVMFGRAPRDEHFQRALGDLMGARTGTDVTQSLLRHVTEMVGARGAALLDEDGRVADAYGDVEDPGEGGTRTGTEATSDAGTVRDGGSDAEGRDTPGERIELPLDSGSLVVWTSPHTPVFGRKELAVISSLGQLAGMALDRSDLFDRERKAHDALRRQIDFSRMLVESSMDGILAFDRNYRYTLWNQGMERLTGIKRADVIGQSAFDVFPFLKEIGEDRHFDGALAGHETVSREQPFDVPATGRRGFFEGRYAPLYGSEGDVVGGLAIVTDVTDRMRVEQEREQRQREEVARAEAEARSEMIEHLQAVTDTALGNLTLDEMVEKLLDRIREVLNMDVAGLALVDESGGALTSSAAAGLEEDVRGLRIAVGEGFLGRVAAERRPLAIESLRREGTVSPLLYDSGIRSVLAVPLLVGGTLIGTLYIGQRQRRSFTAADRTWLQLIADRVALAVQQAGIFEREHRIAETLQRSLLPEHLPEIPGVAIAARYLAGGAGAVGGDWYDVVPLGDGRLGLAMGDVVGHGTAAAALMGQLRSALRAYALEDANPAKVLGRLDRLLQSLGSSGMATLLYVVVDTHQSAAVMGSAGHLPPLLRFADGRTSFLSEAPSVPLGVQARPKFEDRHFQLDPGTTLVLYTDGLIERRGSTLDEGFRALEASVVNAPESPEALCDHVVTELSSAAPSDDTALLVIQPQATGADELSLRQPAEPQALLRIRSAMRRWLSDAGVSAADAYEVLVACGEACANAVEHAYGPGDASFEVEARLADGEVRITVRDFGTWRPPRGRERGRGLRLMEELMDTSEVIRDDGGTTIRLGRTIEREAVS